MTWVSCTTDSNYEIFTQFPYQIRKKSNKRIVTEGDDYSNGYVYVYLNQRKYWKHRVIAKQFIPNPHNLPDVNHKNRDRNDNRPENLEWCSISYNNANKAKHTYKYKFTRTLPGGAKELKKYNDDTFDNVWYCNGKFYRATGNKGEYRILPILKMKNKRSKYVYLRNKKGEQVGVYVNKVKQLMSPH